MNPYRPDLDCVTLFGTIALFASTKGFSGLSGLTLPMPIVDNLLTVALACSSFLNVTETLVLRF